MRTLFRRCWSKKNGKDASRGIDRRSILLKFCKDISKTLNGRLAAAASSGGDDHECCVPVVDSNTFIFTIGGAAVAVWFLRFTKHYSFNLQ